MYFPTTNFAFFPILTAFYKCFLYTGCYTLGYLHGHFDPVLPVVSDSGNYMPESAIFTMTIITVGNLLFIVFTIRYLQILAVISTEHVFKRLLCTYLEVPLQPDGNFAYHDHDISHYQAKYRWWATVNYILGISCSYSAMYVGAYRFAESFLYHNLVGIGVFISAPVYLIVDIFFSRLMTGAVNSQCTATVRHVIGAVMLTSCVVFHLVQTLLFNVPAYHEVFVNPLKRLFWVSTNQEGMLIHLVHSFSEWIYLFSLAFYVYSLAPDFARISFSKLQLQYAFCEEEEEGTEVETTAVNTLSPRSSGQKRNRSSSMDGSLTPMTPLAPMTGRSASHSDVVEKNTTTLGRK